MLIGTPQAPGIILTVSGCPFLLFGETFMVGCMTVFIEYDVTCLQLLILSSWGMQ